MRAIKHTQLLLLLSVSACLAVPASGWPLPQTGKTTQNPLGASAKPTGEISALEAGWHAYKEGRIDQAIIFYQQAASSSPKDASLWYDLGCLFALHQEPEKAQEALKQAIALNASFAEAHDALGQLDEQAGNFDQAKIFYLQAQKLKPASPAILKHLARLAIRSSDEDAAKNWAVAWVAIEPNNPDARYQLGSLYLRAKHPDLAIIELERAVKEDPNHVLAWNGLGLSYSRIGRVEQSAEAFEKAKQLQPEKK